MTTDKLAVIVPVSERVDSVKDLYHAYRAGLMPTDIDLEFTYVLDGEYPNVLKSLKELREAGEPINVVQLARSFGEATALTAGFQNTSANAILLLPSYYQVESAELSRVVDALSTCDMVVVRRWPRVDSLFDRAQTGLFHWVVKFLTGSPLRDLGCGVRAFARRVIDEVPLYGDQHRFLPLLAERQGFDIREIDLPQSANEQSRRFYPIGVYPRRVLDLLTVFFLIKFTKKPLRFFGLIGTTVFFVGAVATLYLIVERLALGIALADRPALLLSSLLLVLGVQVFALGLIGELIIFAHARDVKEYSIKETVGFDKPKKDPSMGAVSSTAVREA